MRLDRQAASAQRGDVTRSANAVVTLTDAPAGTAGVPDTNFVVQLDGPVRVILPLADGRAVLAGTFTNVNGQSTDSSART